MSKQPLEAAQAHKVVTSTTNTSPPGVPFGDRARHASALDQLALRGSGYDPELAYMMAVISAWSYADETVLAAKLRYYGLVGARIRRISVQNSALLVVTTAYLIQSGSGRSAVLAFRGTDPANFIALLTDGQVMQQPFLKTLVHAGFYASVEVVWDDVHTALMAALEGAYLDENGVKQPLEAPLEHLYMTGHSLGGAMAVLASARLFQPDYARLDAQKRVKGVYTFGQPMVGNTAFAQLCEQAFGDRLYRHVYSDDFVPHLPPKSSLDYAHSGGEYYAANLSHDFAFRKQPSRRGYLGFVVGSVFLNAIEARTTPRDALPGYSIDDHLPEKYLQVCRGTLNPSGRVVPPKQGLLPRLEDWFSDRWQIVRSSVPNGASSRRRWSKGHLRKPASA